MNNFSKKSGNVKDKNGIFSGYQIFITEEILVFIGVYVVVKQ